MGITYWVKMQRQHGRLPSIPGLGGVSIGPGVRFAVPLAAPHLVPRTSGVPGRGDNHKTVLAELSIRGAKKSEIFVGSMDRNGEAFEALEAAPDGKRKARSIVDRRDPQTSWRHPQKA